MTELFFVSSALLVHCLMFDSMLSRGGGGIGASDRSSSLSSGMGGLSSGGGSADGRGGMGAWGAPPNITDHSTSSSGGSYHDSQGMDHSGRPPMQGTVHSL